MVQCKICGNNFQKISKHLVKHKISSRDYYDQYIRKNGEGLCLKCKNPTKFIGPVEGYQKYCSRECLNSSLLVKEKRKNTMLKIYGVENAQHSQKLRDKSKQTCLKKYGVENPFQSEEVKDKIKETIRSKYGVDNIMQCEEGKTFCREGCLQSIGVEHPMQDKTVKETIRKTNLKRYGVENPSQLEEVKEKKRQTCLENYGVEFPMQSKEVRDLSKKTCLKKYRVDNISKSIENKSKVKNIFLEKFGGYPLQNKSIQQKFKETLLSKYGVESPLQSEEIRNNFKQTCLNKFGVDNPLKNKNVIQKCKDSMIYKYGVEFPLQSVSIRNKFKQTSQVRFGADHPFKNESIVQKCKNTRKQNFFRILMNSNRIKEVCIPNFTIDEYYGVDYDFKYTWTCAKCQTVFEDHLDDGHIPRCPTCHPKLVGVSKIEKEVGEFISSLGINIEENNRRILEGKELDIYVISNSLAIEFDGLYWHSELNGKDKNYHLNKTLMCQEKGIQLLHIFEDEWVDKQEIVKSIIKSKLGMIENKIFARKCQIQFVPNDEAKLFLFDNHLQGPINGKHIGLYYEDELVSMITIGKSRFSNTEVYEILRFCSKINNTVVGGLSKLLKYANLNSIITYADLRYGTGESYLNCGFEYIGTSDPSFYYIKDGKRINRLNFQKHLLQEKLDIFDPTLTGWQNMQLNGYDRIWDCGVAKYILTNE